MTNIFHLQNSSESFYNYILKGQVIGETDPIIDHIKPLGHTKEVNYLKEIEHCSGNRCIIFWLLF